ncbi:gamma-glutamyl-gamma-aminobutyrate hydrolase family protein [Candidatus Kapabacteria bacterium]|nr:gamma-glutamyl-gamma-aminobutyrate hydrolase family protein [Candidatus Kapabacteria bacterium]
MKIIISILLILSIISCNKQSDTKNLTIAISKASGDPVYKNYVNWLRDKDSTIIVIDLVGKSISEANNILENVDGLLLSGGPDPHPGRYGKTADTNRCDIDLQRDTLEFGVYKKAKELKIPILGVCRGMQVINVAEGGSLIVDIENDFKNSIDNLHQNGLPQDAIHKVNLVSSSNLFTLTNKESGEINCNHHQGIDKLSDSFKPSSHSEDGLIESFENINESTWIMAVQWHPERLKIKGLSNPIRDEFLKICKLK